MPFPVPETTVVSTVPTRPRFPADGRRLDAVRDEIAAVLADFEPGTGDGDAWAAVRAAVTAVLGSHDLYDSALVIDPAALTVQAGVAFRAGERYTLGFRLIPLGFEVAA